MRFGFALAAFGAMIFGFSGAAQAQIDKEDYPDIIDEKVEAPHILFFDSFQADKVAGATETFTSSYGPEDSHIYTWVDFEYTNEEQLYFSDPAEAGEEEAPEEHVVQLDLTFGIYVYGAALKRSEDGLQFIVRYGRGFAPEKQNREDSKARLRTKNYAGMQLAVYDDNGDVAGVLDNNDNLLDESRFRYFRDCEMDAFAKGLNAQDQNIGPMNQGVIEKLKVSFECDKDVFSYPDLWFGQGNDFKERLQEKFGGGSGIELDFEDKDGPEVCVEEAPCETLD
jgi:hypothetical protein